MAFAFKTDFREILLGKQLKDISRESTLELLENLLDKLVEKRQALLKRQELLHDTKKFDSFKEQLVNSRRSSKRSSFSNFETPQNMVYPMPLQINRDADIETSR